MLVDTSRVVAGNLLELRLREPAPTDAQVMLLPTGAGKENNSPLPLTVQSESGGHWVDLTQTDIPTGVWATRWVGPGGKQQPISTTDPCYDVAALRERLAAGPGCEFVPVRTSTGRLRLRVRETSAYARAEHVRVSGEEITLSGTLAHLTTPPAAAHGELLLRQRGLAGEHRTPVKVNGAAFTAVVPLTPLADDHESARKHNEWDLRLCLPDGTDLQVGTHEDDIVGKKGKISFPSVIVQAATGSVKLRPYYTVADQLAVLGTAADGEAG